MAPNTQTAHHQSVCDGDPHLVIRPPSVARSIRTQQTAVASIAITSFACIAVYLTFHLWRDFREWNIPKRVESTSLVESIDDLKQARRIASEKCKDLEVSVRKLQDSLVDHARKIKEESAALVDPGPEPSWWIHPFNHSVWSAKKKVFDKCNEEIQQLKVALDTDQHKIDVYVTQEGSLLQELAEETAHLNSLQSAQGSQQVIDATTTLGRTGWNRYVSPVLHIFFLWYIFRLMAHVALRFALIKGWIGYATV
jgi:hypothetical protein